MIPNFGSTRGREEPAGSHRHSPLSNTNRKRNGAENVVRTGIGKLEDHHSKSDLEVA